MSRIVAIVGRPNVGKSTFFNRLTDSREAIVDEISGVTRDRNYGPSNWNGVDFSVIDTGGYVQNSDDIFEEEINKQVILAIEESDLILFMVDVTVGIHALDDAVASLLRKVNKKVIVVVNKVDNNERLADAAEFYHLDLVIIFRSAQSTEAVQEIFLMKLSKIFRKMLRWKHPIFQELQL